MKGKGGKSGEWGKMRGGVGGKRGNREGDIVRLIKHTRKIDTDIVTERETVIIEINRHVSIAR